MGRTLIESILHSDSFEKLSVAAADQSDGTSNCFARSIIRQCDAAAVRFCREFDRPHQHHLYVPGHRLHEYSRVMQSSVATLSARNCLRSSDSVLGPANQPGRPVPSPSDEWNERAR